MNWPAPFDPTGVMHFIMGHICKYSMIGRSIANVYSPLVYINMVICRDILYVHVYCMVSCEMDKPLDIKHFLKRCHFAQKYISHIYVYRTTSQCLISGGAISVLYIMCMPYHITPDWPSLLYIPALCIVQYSAGGPMC